MGFTSQLLEWFEFHKRDLPWRRTADPYKIWVSEIILQQTRVEQGLDYYIGFIRKFPTIKALRQASSDELMNIWQGLGYYSRARNMHVAAAQIEDLYGGHFPDSYDELLKLKGIGPYTAAAIASIAFSEARAVVDGNVFRVLARIFGMEDDILSNAGKKRFSQKADELLYRKDPGRYNQALMDFGAMQCTPQNPQCSDCPFKNDCIAYSKDLINAFPVKKKKRKARTRFFHYLIITCGDQVFIEKRSKKDIWHSLYQFPLIETLIGEPPEQFIKSRVFKDFFVDCQPRLLFFSDDYVHQLTHQKLFTRFYHLRIDSSCAFLQREFLSVKKDDVFRFPLPELLVKYLINHRDEYINS